MGQWQLQIVEGFNSIISFAGKVQLADYRGATLAWSTELWWLVGPQDGLAWNTAACEKAEDSVFSFVGISANLPYGTLYGNRAELTVNGEHALNFELGIRRRAEWSEGDFALEFQPKSIDTPFEGYHRHWEMKGNSGIYRLAVPARIVEPGNGARIDVKLLPRDTDCITWFMIADRKDTLKGDLEVMAEEMTQLKADYARLKNVTNSLARMVYRDHFADSVDVEHAIIWTHRRNCVMKADIARLQDGDLLLAFREGPEHSAGFSPTVNGRVCTLRSQDNGQSWGEFQVVAERHHQDHRDPSMTQLADGTILMPYCHCDRYDESGRVTSLFEHIHLIKSHDGGHTWDEEPQHVDYSPFGSALTENKCLELPNGRILLPFDNVAPEEGETKAAAVLKSDDKGGSWQYLSTICTEDPKTGLPPWPCEPALARVASGRLVCVIRSLTRPTPPHGGFLWQSYSDDDGETWCEPWETSLPGQAKGELLVLRDGRLLCTVGFRNDERATYGGISNFETNGIAVTISEDEGQTWGPLRTLRDDFPNPDCGYPASVELEEEGKILTVYWYNMFDQYFIGGTLWRS